MRLSAIIAVSVSLCAQDIGPRIERVANSASGQVSTQAAPAIGSFSHIVISGRDFTRDASCASRTFPLLVALCSDNVQVLLGAEPIELLTVTPSRIEAIVGRQQGSLEVRVKRGASTSAPVATFVADRAPAFFGYKPVHGYDAADKKDIFVFNPSTVVASALRVGNKVVSPTETARPREQVWLFATGTGPVRQVVTPLPDYPWFTIKMLDPPDVRVNGTAVAATAGIYSFLPTVTMVGFTMPDGPSGVYKVEIMNAGRASPPVYVPVSRAERSIAGNVTMLEPSSRGDVLKDIHVRAKGSCGVMDAYANENGDYVVDACAGGNRFGFNGKTGFYTWEKSVSLATSTPRTTEPPVKMLPKEYDPVEKGIAVERPAGSGRYYWDINGTPLDVHDMLRTFTVSGIVSVCGTPNSIIRRHTFPVNVYIPTVGAPQYNPPQEGFTNGAEALKKALLDVEKLARVPAGSLFTFVNQDPLPKGDGVRVKWQLPPPGTAGKARIPPEYPDNFCTAGYLTKAELVLMPDAPVKYFPVGVHEMFHAIIAPWAHSPFNSHIMNSSPLADYPAPLELTILRWFPQLAQGTDLSRYLRTSTIF